jgi:hypothetical protein
MSTSVTEKCVPWIEVKHLLVNLHNLYAQNLLSVKYNYRGLFTPEVVSGVLNRIRR